MIVSYFRVFVVVLAFGCLSVPACAQPLDAAARARVIDGVIAKLDALYLFPEKARVMGSALRTRMARREYDGIVDGALLAARLTRDLRTAVDDRHLSVNYRAQAQPLVLAEPIEPPAQEIAALRQEYARRNFGIPRVEVLPGNVGYIAIETLWDVADAGPIWDAALRFVAGTDALMIDLRRCPGAIGPGSEAMINWIAGYLLERATHLLTIRWRPGNRVVEQWTPESVPAPRYLGRPVYLLTSRSTFSGAEALAYALKNRARVTVVGERTGGGAHGGGEVSVDAHFSIWMPMGQAIDPQTGTDWEGVGIAPDLPVFADDAPLAARCHALRLLLATHPQRRVFLASALQEAESALAWARRARARAPRTSFGLSGFASAREVAVAGEFNGWRRTAMRQVRGAWRVQIQLLPGRYAYKFLVDDRWICDPANPRRVRDASGNENSVREVR